MKSLVIGFFLMIAAVSPAFADTKTASKPGGAMVGATTINAMVEAINYETREVTLKQDNGAVEILKVGEIARNFHQIKKGDRVRFEYVEALAIDIQKSTGELSAAADLNIERAPLGAKPAGVIAGTLTLNALVQEIDYKTRHVTLKGPRGNSVTLKVGDQAKRFHEVKKGDQVVVQYTEALGVSVTSPKG